MWKCLAEELYELEEAIIKDDTGNISEELGDALFQLVFILEIYREQGRFSYEDVINGISKKMIRRHPHVYENVKVDSEKELYDQWDKIKAEENQENGKQLDSALDSVPKGLPSLIRAFKVSKSAVKAGFDWDGLDQVLETVKDEIKEFENARASGDEKEMILEFGDILFTLVNVARFAGFHPETALSSSTAKFEGRFRLMEKLLFQKKQHLKKMEREEIDLAWNQAKKSYDR